jgi:hypothetical protein
MWVPLVLQPSMQCFPYTTTDVVAIGGLGDAGEVATSIVIVITVYGIPLTRQERMEKNEI